MLLALKAVIDFYYLSVNVLRFIITENKITKKRTNSETTVIDVQVTNQVQNSVKSTNEYRSL